MLKATKRSQYFEKLLCDSVWPMLKRFFSPSSSFMFRKHRQCLWFLNKSLRCTLYFICLYNLIWIKWCWLKLKSLRKERDIGNSVVLRFCKVILSLVKNVLHHFMLIIATASLADVTHPEFHNRHLRKKKYIYRAAKYMNHRRVNWRKYNVFSIHPKFQWSQDDDKNTLSSFMMIC